ncbi:hypothetical protein GCM10007160_42080 [Litchfieldella qijiaojingensis]|uniref:Uncharacterized protein n=1 Tax=Litchfieldella qijiaojingensis TaxID=980347 RepID=A0ABQ2ZAV3_9GAMM|nr:hypothetical protein [Halomonas qijiaojingensis]GGY10406.1 hypothetical protein GCM10007160_42080 [Halomonas qijiaojingensis]
MITFHREEDAFGPITLFRVDGRNAGYIFKSLEGAYLIYFADMADAPSGVPLERSTVPGRRSIFAVDIPSLEAAIDLVIQAYLGQGTTGSSHHNNSQFMARDAAHPYPVASPRTAERATLSSPTPCQRNHA